MNAILFHGDADSRALMKQYEFYFDEKDSKSKSKNKKKVNFF